MDEGLEAFLAGKSGQPVPIDLVQPVAATEPVVVETVVIEAPAPEPEHDAAPEPVASTTAPVPEEDDDAPASSNSGTVPVHVLQAERNKRKDYKAQVIRQDEQIKAAEERFKALQAQLDELKKAPAPTPVAAAVTQVAQAVQAAVEPPAEKPDPMPHPAEDPEGFVAWQGRQMARVQEQQNLMAFNTRLETTEDLLREKEGDEAVDKAVARFKEMVAAEEQQFGARQSPLAKSLTVQRNPYRWMYNTVKKDAADREIGGDLAGFKAKTETEVRAKVEAEIRAQIEAEFAEKAAAAAAALPPITIAPVQVRAAPNVVLPKSLANTPSAAPRSAPAWTGPTALADIVAQR